MTTRFTSSAARSVVASGPIRFGDPTLIAAVQYLRDKQTARDALKDCEHGICLGCDGTGTAFWARHEEGQALCDGCNGTGTDYECHCFAGLNKYAVRDARIAARKERKR